MPKPFRSSKSRQELSQLLRATDGWITVEDAANVLTLERSAAAKRLARWAEQGWLKRVQRGHYAPRPLERGGATFAVFSSRGGSSIGLRSQWMGSTRVPVSGPERTLIDILSQPQAGGGIQHVSDCLREYTRADSANIGRLIEMAHEIGNGAVLKRMGFLLEQGKLALPEQVESCRTDLTQGLAKLDPSASCPRIVTRWRLRVPQSWRDSIDGSVS